MSRTAAAAMPDFTGCTVDERFQLVRMLGSGTYGVVYQAVDTHPSSGKGFPSRAIKIIRKAGRKPHELAAARRECALHSLISDHPNIVTVYDAYEDDNFFYIIMDFCRGGDLFEPICRRVYADNDVLLRTAFVSLIDAVAACHSARIYHRDLKPENILVSEDRSQVYLADFGLASNQLIVSEFYCGTAAYMSPECIGHLSGYKPYYPAFSDVWSLGVILVNMISGRNPWERATLDDPCFIQFIEHPDFLFDMLPISEGANDIIRRIFVLNPVSRIRLQELRRAILGLETFFRYEDELAVVEEYTRDTAATLGEPHACPKTPVDASLAVKEDGPKSSARGLTSASPATSEARSHLPLLPSLPTLCSSGCSAGSTVTSSSSDGSSPESSLIITAPSSAIALVCEEERDDSNRILQDTKAPVLTATLFDSPTCSSIVTRDSSPVVSTRPESSRNA